MKIVSKNNCCISIFTQHTNDVDDMIYIYVMIYIYIS